MVKVDMAGPLQIGAQRGALKSADDKFLTRDDRALRQQNANITNWLPEHGAFKSADDRFPPLGANTTNWAQPVGQLQQKVLKSADDEFLQRDDRAMRQQNANATNRHDERATVRTADANDRFLTPAMIEACRLLSAEFSSQKSARDAEELSLIHI